MTKRKGASPWIGRLAGCVGGLLLYGVICQPKAFPEAQKTAQSAPPSDDESTLTKPETSPNAIFPAVPDTNIVSAERHETKVPGMPLAWTLPQGAKPDGLPLQFGFGNDSAERLHAKAEVRGYKLPPYTPGEGETIIVKHLKFPPKAADTWKGDDATIAKNIYNTEEYPASMRFQTFNHNGSLVYPDSKAWFEGGSFFSAGWDADGGFLSRVSYRRGEAFIVYYNWFLAGPDFPRWEAMLRTVHWTN